MIQRTHWMSCLSSMHFLRSVSRVSVWFFVFCFGDDLVACSSFQQAGLTCSKRQTAKPGTTQASDRPCCLQLRAAPTAMQHTLCWVIQIKRKRRSSVWNKNIYMVVNRFSALTTHPRHIRNRHLMCLMKLPPVCQDGSLDHISIVFLAPPLSLHSLLPSPAISW